jgi:hypothetical protein
VWGLSLWGSAVRAIRISLKVEGALLTAWRAPGRSND